MDCQNKFVGGFSKQHYTEVDLLHTYFGKINSDIQILRYGSPFTKQFIFIGICGLSLMEEPGLQEMHPALNMSLKAYSHLKKLHESWNNSI